MKNPLAVKLALDQGQERAYLRRYIIVYCFLNGIKDDHMSFLWTTQNHRARRANRRPNLEFKSHDFMFCAVISFLYALIC